MRFRNIVCVAGALGLACEQNPAAPAPAGVTHTYDIVAEFSSTLNSDTSVWSYRFQSGQTRDGNYQLVPAFGADTVETWSPSDPGAWRVQGYLPSVGVNNTGTDITVAGTGVNWPNGTMLVHPGSDQLVVVSWLAPSDGIANISFSFTSRHAVCGDGIQWFVEQNGAAATLSTGFIDPGASTGSRSVSGVRVRAGDRINFIVGPRGGNGCDSTQLTATITTG